MTPERPRGGRAQALSFLLGGVLPLIAFTVIEEKYGTFWGLIAGLAFGAGEIAWELIRYRRVSKITWFGNGLLFIMGAISLLTDEGIWFKLQPAIIEAVMALAFWGSLLMRRNLLVWMVQAQGGSFPPEIAPFLNGFCFRLGIFFALHAAVAVEAALHWSTEAWVALKGIGLFASFIVYLFLEIVYIRWRRRL